MYCDQTIDSDSEQLAGEDKDPGTDKQASGFGRDITAGNSRNLELTTGCMDRHRSLFSSPIPSTWESKLHFFHQRKARKRGKDPNIYSWL